MKSEHQEGTVAMQEDPAALGQEGRGRHVVDFRYAPTNAWACLGRPDDTFKTIARDDGALLYGFNRDWWRPVPVYFNRVIALTLLTDQRPVEVRQRTESGRSGILVTTLRYPKATLTLTAFGHLQEDGKRSDIVLWSIQAARGVRELLTGLWIALQEPGHCFLPRRYPQPDHAVLAVGWDKGPWPIAANHPAGTVEHLLAEGKTALVSVGHKLRPHAAPGFAAWPALATELKLLGEGQELRGAIVIPLNHELPGEIAESWVASALVEERRFWQEIELQRITLEVPQQDVMELVEASARSILQAREVKKGLPEFQVGPTFYRGLWVADGHFLLEAARYLGYAPEADRGIDVLLRRVKSDGSIAAFPFHHKETGISLATLVRQTELSGNWERLRSLWPIVRNAVGFIQQLRRQAYELPASSPAHGLMPPSFGDGGLCGAHPEYTTCLWTLAGLKQIAQAARFLGEEADAETWQREFDSLLTDFRTHAQRDMGTLPDGTPYLPICKPGGSESLVDPEFQGQAPVWERVNPASGTWALCHAIYPGEVFAPDDPVVRNLLHLLDGIDDEEEIPSGTGLLSYQALWPYYASFAAHVWLYAGRADKAVDYLYGFANHAAPTRVWREEQFWRDSQHGGGVASGDMPHNWASAEFVRLVRDLLVFERGAELELLAGLPLEWIVRGKSVRVERTPTRFGPVTVTLTLDELGQGRIVVERDVRWSIQPSAVRLHLPTNADLHSIQVNESPWPLEERRHLLLPAEPRTIIRFQSNA